MGEGEIAFSRKGGEKPDKKTGKDETCHVDSDHTTLTSKKIKEYKALSKKARVGQNIEHQP